MGFFQFSILKKVPSLLVKMVKEYPFVLFLSGPLKAEDVTAEGCTLKWEKPEDDGGKPITGKFSSRAVHKGRLIDKSKRLINLSKDMIFFKAL